MNGGDYSFVYDTTAGIPAVIEEVKSGDVPVYYIREPGGELIARSQGTNWSFYHFDELGSTRLLTDGSGSVTDRYAYDAWGKTLTHDRYTGSIDQPYQYVGRLW
jgi:peptidoglycan/xylan/chitin deacetylase (PgdA/CDA1 family)